MSASKQPDPPYELMRDESTMSPLERARQKFQPLLPKALADEDATGSPKFTAIGEPTKAKGYPEEINRLFPNLYGRQVMKLVGDSHDSDPLPLRVGCVLSGGQAAGGHNVVIGLYESIKAHHPDSRLFGFTGGPKGIIINRFLEIEERHTTVYRNTGGFDMIGTGRDKIEKPEEFVAALKTVRDLNLDGLVVIGGDDSNTNAAVLAEYFLAQGHTKCAVVGCPKTIDNDLKNDFVEISFGFDTACKIYAEMIGNICTDSNSAQKYWHFVRLMGRAASHITLECALATHPNVCLLGEEVRDKQQTLAQITAELADVIEARAKTGRNFGVVLVPEGLIEFIPEIGKLLGALNELLAQGVAAEYVRAKLLEFRGTDKSPLSESEVRELVALFDMLPHDIRHQLLLDRDPHGNVQVSKIETEKLLIDLVAHELRRRKGMGTYIGSFASLTHFLGYEGRCSLPSNFDATYCYTLGRIAGLVVLAGLTGYMAVARYLTRPVTEWEPCAIPLTAMMTTERRRGAYKAVIEKALVHLDGLPFKTLEKKRGEWALGEFYCSPGPMQFAGETANYVTHTLRLEARDRYPGH